MAFRTFGSLKSQLESELDLEDEDFISVDEMMGLWNHAVSVAEGHIITLGLKDKYFLCRAKLSTVTGAEVITIPANLYANKIIKVIYHNGATLYTVKPLYSKDMFENYVYLNSFTSTDFYRYFIDHTTPGTEKFILVPAARETIANVMDIWYYRDANRYTTDTDICDLPEIAYEFLHIYVKELCYAKESHVNYEGCKQERMEKEQLMQSILSGQIDDNEMSKSEMDLSSYQESS